MTQIHGGHQVTNLPKPLWQLIDAIKKRTQNHEKDYSSHNLGEKYTNNNAIFMKFI